MTGRGDSIPGPRSRELLRRLARVECPDTTYITDDFPIVWRSAKGLFVEDVDGNRYLDLNAGFGVAAVGHAHPRVVEAIRRQSQKLVHGMGDVHPSDVKIELAEEIVKRAPGGGDWQVIFGLSGSDAVEAALKTAALATGKERVLAFEGGYHGLSLGALGVIGLPEFRNKESLESLRGGIVRVPRSEKLDEAAYAFETIDPRLESDDSAPAGAVIIEPIRGRGGVVSAPKRFLEMMRSVCDSNGNILIFDEIYTGFGRAGSWFVCEEAGVVPDILLCGKALGGGMPISICMGRRELMERWGRSPHGARHTSTFQGHPLACAAALETLRIIESEGLVERSRRSGEAFKAMLKERIGGDPGVDEIRGRGLMLGVALKDGDGKADGARARRVMVECLRRGIVVLVAGLEGEVISLTPPLIISEEQLETAARTLAEAMKAVPMS